MANFIESLILAILALRANLLRSILTTIGIIVGVTSVIAVVSIMQGFTDKLTQDFENMGSNVIVIAPHSSFNDQMRGKFGKLTMQDLAAIQRTVDDAEKIIPLYYLQGVQMEYQGTRTTVFGFYGTTSDWAEVNSHYPETGRFIVPSDNDYRRRVVVLGPEAREDLDMPDDFIGEYIKIFGQWYKVVGEMEERGSIFGLSRDNEGYVPFETVDDLLGKSSFQMLQISVKLNETADADETIENIEHLLRSRHNLGPDDNDDFRVQSAEQIKEQQEETLGSFTVIVSAIVGISLIVGGIGIMNIMLVSVTERTKEIGICKALGAKRSHILVQFLAEAVILCLLGGLIGVGLGYGLGLLIGTTIPGMGTVVVPLWAVGLSLAFCSVIGIVFGIVPASKAANMDPIEALHYE